MSQRRKFRRPLGERRYKKLFLLATEGVKTELIYFSRFVDEASVVRVQCLRGSHGSSPPQVLSRMNQALKREQIQAYDEAWLVVDKDQWTNPQLEQLHRWSLKSPNYGFALSNPKFEYWLLLHFEDGNGVGSSRDCVERIRRWIAGYDKAVDARKFSVEQIKTAIARAKQRDQPPCKDWPRMAGQTTVYRLVENILAASETAVE